MPKFDFKIQTLTVFFCILSVAFLLGCGSVPNLESPECIESRDNVKQFYSFHFGNEMKFSQENLKLRDKYLTPQLFKSLQNSPPENDVFTTNNTDFPKAFRLGSCETIAPDKTETQVLLFWKTDTRSEQREIKIESIKNNNQWLINRVFNK